MKILKTFENFFNPALNMFGEMGSDEKKKKKKKEKR
jgi:hypothetical protein